MIYLFSQKMLENLFNYATSFAASPMDMRQKPGIIRKAKSDSQQYSLNQCLGSESGSVGSARFWLPESGSVSVYQP